ncbi:hypothetical protein [Mesonia aquimarina]|uniref:hypothetical protein n=1 Tax=Mesonia aquimarina TaxID=1504967 RepID=UPI000EF5B323|nr:hypothetical protein [Mesonia aquimarina]
MIRKNFFWTLKNLAICGSFFLIACKEEAVEEEKQKTFQQETAEALSKEVKLSSNRTIELITEAKETTANWSAYLTLKNEIESFENSTYQEVINGSNNLVESLVAVKTTLPEDFKVTPVYARIKVLITQAQVLHQDVENPRVEPARIDTLVNEIYKSFGDLKIQLNEVYLKTLEDLESEFDDAIQPDTLQETTENKAVDSIKTN